MKFACDRCGKMYVLADDKIAAKSDVRLKCRQCGEVIVVKQAGEIVAKSPATPVPRLPLPEGAVPLPSMPRQLNRPGSRTPPTPPTSEDEEDEPVRAPVGALPRASAPELPRLSGPGRPRPSLPRPSPLSSKRANAPPEAEAAAEAPAEPHPEADPAATVRASDGPARDESDVAAPVEPILGLVTPSDEDQPFAIAAQAGGAASTLPSVTPVTGRLWLGASSAAEKRRMLIALGVGFVLGTLVGLVV